MSERNVYQDLMEQHLRLWRVRLEERRRQAASDTSVELHEQLEDWRAGGKAAQSKLGELSAATGDRWEAIRLELEKLWHAIEAVLAMDVSAAPSPGAVAANAAATPRIW